MSFLAQSPPPINQTDAQSWARRQRHVQGILDEWLAEFETARQAVSSYVTTGPSDITRRIQAMRDIPYQRLAIASLRRELADIAERVVA